MNVLPFDTRVRVIAALLEGNSIRSSERLCGVHRDTVMRLGVTVGEACGRLHRNRVRNVCSAMIECDEIWAFVWKKQARRKPEDDPSWGDQYTFVGIDPTTKLAISYLVGQRDLPTATAFAKDLRSRVVGTPQLNTDGLPSYPEAFEQAFGTKHHHGVAVKIYQNPGDGGPEHRYSPGRVIGVQRTRRAGTPDEELTCTSRVERQNLNMRMCMRRFTRLTNGFSKTVENLRAAVALHFGFYTWCRPHETTRVTPAMAAGLSKTAWSLPELLEIALTEPEDESAPKAQATATRIVPSLRVIQGGRA